MFRSITLCAAALLLLAFASQAVAKKVVITVETPPHEVARQTPPFSGTRPTVDVAILLDTSNSMDGLIDQAKRQLWTIVGQFAKAKKQGQTPSLRVALFEYGNNGLPASEGYIRQVVPLTDDLDKLSESLFALTTNGGDEYCGQVINEAITRLDWSSEPNGYKAIFIAGNEPFTQGSVSYQDACRRAIERGVVVNTIHCGGHQEGLRGMWQAGALLAEGEFFNINQDRAVVQIKCPQDEILIRLNTELNRTYLWYGDRTSRLERAANQVAQDGNASGLSSDVLAQRVAVKGCPSYSNRGRDLCDTWEADADILKNVKTEDLPEPLQKLSIVEREVYVREMVAKRAGVKKKIAELAAQRELHIAKERQRLAEETGDATLGDAVVITIRKQLADAGFEQAK